MGCKEWKEFALSDLISILGGGTPKTSISKYWNGDIPWLSIKDFNVVNRKIYKTEKTITKLGLEQSSTKLLDVGDIVISARGTVGALVQLGRPMAFNQSCYGLKANEKTTSDFLYYLLKYKIQDLKKRAHGSVFDTITRGTFDILTARIPEDKNEQATIARILSSLDDKIELNTKINRVLEEIAQAIFKHWFIDFEFPVVLAYPDYISEETKKELMKYGYKSFGGLPAPELGKFFVYALECEDGSIYIGQTDFLLQSWHEHVSGKVSEHTRNHKSVRFVYWEKVNSQKEALEREKWLKTDLGRKWLEREISNNPMNQGGEMQPSPLGLIPKGWEVSQISEFGKVVCGKTPPKKEKDYYDGGQIPFIKIPDMHNQTFVVETNDKLTEKAISYMRNKLIPTGSICVSCIATVGKVALAAKDSFTNQQINSIIPKETGWSFYLYFIMKQKEDELNLLASGGSATLNLNTREFSKIKLLRPQKCIAQEFENLANPLFVKILKNQLENLTLSNLRDVLLPKLMSGEIRIPMDE